VRQSSQEFSAPHGGETMRWTPKTCKKVLKVLYHHAKFGGAQISPMAGVAKNGEFFVCHSHLWSNLPPCNLLSGAGVVAA